MATRRRLFGALIFVGLLALAAPAHATEVSHWETGRNLPRPGRQRQIARALGLTPQEFAATQTTGTIGDRR